jgi:hypothetical protein
VKQVMDQAVEKLVPHEVQTNLKRSANEFSHGLFGQPLLKAGTGDAKAPQVKLAVDAYLRRQVAAQYPQFKGKVDSIEQLVFFEGNRGVSALWKDRDRHASQSSSGRIVDAKSLLGIAGQAKLQEARAALGRQGYSSYEGDLYGGKVVATPGQKDGPGNAPWEVTFQSKSMGSTTVTAALRGQFGDKQLTEGGFVKSRIGAFVFAQRAKATVPANVTQASFAAIGINAPSAARAHQFYGAMRRQGYSIDEAWSRTWAVHNEGFANTGVLVKQTAAAFGIDLVHLVLERLSIGTAPTANEWIAWGINTVTSGLQNLVPHAVTPRAPRTAPPQARLPAHPSTNVSAPTDRYVQPRTLQQVQQREQQVQQTSIQPTQKQTEQQPQQGKISAGDPGHKRTPAPSDLRGRWSAEATRAIEVLRNAGTKLSAWLFEPGISERADPVVSRETNSRSNRATERLSAPMLAVLHAKVNAFSHVDDLIDAIRSTVRSSFSTDATLGSHLGNQLAFDRAFNERLQAKATTWHGFVDVGGVGLTNTQVSRFAGDTVLEAVHATAAVVARQLNREFGLKGADAVEAYAVGGDEVRFMAGSRQSVERFARRFAAAMKDTRVEGFAGEEGSSPTLAALSGIPVYVGTGQTIDAAEAASNLRKASDKGRVPGRLPMGYEVRQLRVEGELSTRSNVESWSSGWGVPCEP